MILDYSMPVMSGMAAAKRNSSTNANVPIIMLSMHDGKPLVDAPQLIGARGFVPKAECADRLLEAVDTVLRGETFFEHEPSRTWAGRCSSGWR